MTKISVCCFIFLFLWGCFSKKKDNPLQQELASLDIARGEIALCGGEGRFGTVDFSLSCSEEVRSDFNLATALLHSFEYTEAEKVFAKVMDKDPNCVMAYWGVAMSNFHLLWTPPSKGELEKGSKIISLARSLDSKSQSESDYLEAVAALYDDWSTLDNRTRLLKFEQATEKVYRKYPEDKEAAIYYALALRAASDPEDKTFVKQRKAGEILNALFLSNPDHPGVAHYLIHNYDYPELAALGLPAATKYAEIAASSAHALHMPSHIFTRLGLWKESVNANLNSISAARCYAENSKMTGNWGEELHGIDYLVYAYLQQAQDAKAKEQLDYLKTLKADASLDNKGAYTFAAVPARYAMERNDWQAASKLELYPKDFPWENYPWEASMIYFGRILGAAHVHNTEATKADLKVLEDNYKTLVAKNKSYEANQVQIQIKASEGWIKFAEGDKKEAVKLLAEAANMEDATEKHPVTPGEIIPARELLAALYMEMGEFSEALVAYESDIERHAGRFNALYGAGLAAQKTGDREKAAKYFEQLIKIASLSDNQRPELATAKAFLQTNGNL
jgi:hypothetical protein